MLNLHSDAIAIYNSMPIKARNELKDCTNPGWINTKNAVLGWQWSANLSKDASLIGNDVSVITSTPMFYLEKIVNLFSPTEITFDLQQDLNKIYQAKAFYQGDGEEVIQTEHEDLITCLLMLFDNCYKVYYKYFSPSIKDAAGASNFFQDREKHLAITFDDVNRAKEFTNKYYRFSEPSYSYEDLTQDSEQYHGKINLVEGLVKIYSHYGKPKIKPTSLFGSTLFSSTLGYSIGSISYPNYYTITSSPFSSITIGSPDSKPIKWRNK